MIRRSLSCHLWQRNRLFLTPTQSIVWMRSFGDSPYIYIYMWVLEHFFTVARGPWIEITVRTKVTYHHDNIMFIFQVFWQLKSIFYILSVDGVPCSYCFDFRVIFRFTLKSAKRHFCIYDVCQGRNICIYLNFKIYIYINFPQ